VVSDEIKLDLNVQLQQVKQEAQTDSGKIAA
jgi:hypothetical protein